MRPAHPLTYVIVVATAAALLVGPSAAASVTQESAEPPGAAAAPAEGTQPVYDYGTAIREQFMVESAVDSDGDGRGDRVAVRVIRPRDTQDGVRVPVILQPSPYFAGVNHVPAHNDVDRDASLRRGAAPTLNRAETITFAGYLDNYFVPRGYAVIYADSLGTGGSEGCPTSGGDNETQGMKAVVDWLNGRAEGIDGAGAPAAADWSTGKVGMIGVSYNGTLANAVAATGVEGLETIVPIASISSWYDYYRANGGVVAPRLFQGEDTDVLAKAVLTRARPESCATEMADLAAEQDRETGDYSSFWHERNYLRDVGQVRASVFAAQGLNDWNVKTTQIGQWWSALARRDVPRKIWLHQGDHADPFNVRRDEWLKALHRWFDQWLYQIDTGIMREPMADVETSPGRWSRSRSWPVPGTRSVSLAFAGPTADGLSGRLAGRFDGGSGGAGPVAGGARRQTLVDDPTRRAEDLVADESAEDPGRLAYLTPPLAAPVRLSGTARVSVRASIDGESPYLTALLVDYGDAARFAGSAWLPGQDCVAPGVPGDPGCFGRSAHATTVTPWKIVSRGWLDTRNRRSLLRSEEIAPDRFYSFDWLLAPQDHVFEAGHRIGVVIISTDRDYTLRYAAGTRVTVDLGASRVQLPLVTVAGTPG